MSDSISIIATIGVLFLIKFLSGIWLSRSGRPLNGIVLTVHKIVSLLIVVLIAITVRRLRQGIAVSAVETSAIVITGLFFLSAVVSGGLLSTGKPTPAVVGTVHKVTPLLAVLSTATLIYLVAWAKP